MLLAQSGAFAPASTLTSRHTPPVASLVPARLGPLSLAPRLGLVDVAGDRRSAAGRVSLDLQLSLAALAPLNPAFSHSFARGSIGLPGPFGLLSGGPSSSGMGLPVARIGYGLFLGKVSAPVGEIYAYRETQPGAPQVPTNTRFGVEGTLMLSPSWGVHVQASLGDSAFAGVSIVWRPGAR